MNGSERFLRRLALGIIEAGGRAQDDPDGAMQTAVEVLERIREMEPCAYPNLVEVKGMRFVYQWDEVPPVLVVMLWDDLMWRDIARIPVPRGLV